MRVRSTYTAPNGRTFKNRQDANRAGGISEQRTTRQERSSTALSALRPVPR